MSNVIAHLLTLSFLGSLTVLGSENFTVFHIININPLLSSVLLLLIGDGAPYGWIQAWIRLDWAGFDTDLTATPTTITFTTPILRGFFVLFHRLFTDCLPFYFSVSLSCLGVPWISVSVGYLSYTISYMMTQTYICIATSIQSKWHACRIRRLS